MASPRAAIRILFAIVTLFISPFPATGALPLLSMSKIAKGPENTCFVALLSTSDAKLLQTLEEINELLEAAHERTTTPEIRGWRDAKIPFEARQTPQPSLATVKLGEIDEEFQWSNSKQIDITNKSNRPLGNYSLVVFPPVKKDRSCLLSPPKLFPKGVAYFGPHWKETIVDFINVHCNTYLGVNGGLSVEGLHRLNILENLYRLNSTTMAELPEIAKIVDNDTNTCMNSQTSNKNIDATGTEKVSEAFTDREDTDCRQNQALTSECKSDIFKPNPSELKSESQLFVQKMDMPECERITSPTKEAFFNNYLKKSRPAVISNGAAHWPAIKKWTMEFFKKAFGDKQVHIKLAPDGVFEGVEPACLWEENEDFMIPKEVSDKLSFQDLVVVRPAIQNIRFSEFLEMIENSSKTEDRNERLNLSSRVSAYLEYSSIPTYFPQLEDDVVEPHFIQNVLDRRHLNIWVSDGNTLGKLHFDPFDNFLCQLKGRKELILFEPHTSHQLYEAHIPEALLGFDPDSKRFRRRRLMDSTSMVMSPVDIRQPDFGRFPAFAEARPLNCTIDEGDILFMPAFWWHEVQSYPNKIEGRNLAVNFWYEPFLTKEFPCPACKMDVNPYYRHLL